MITNDMMISSEVERFKSGEIRQGTFLKALKDDIFRMVNQNISLPGQIAILEKEFDITLNYLTYKSWVVYNKRKLAKKGEEKSEEEPVKNPPQNNTKNGSSEDPEKESDVEVEVSEKDTSNDSEKSSINAPGKKKVFGPIEIKDNK